MAAVREAENTRRYDCCHNLSASNCRTLPFVNPAANDHSEDTVGERLSSPNREAISRLSQVHLVSRASLRVPRVLNQTPECFRKLHRVRSCFWIARTTPSIMFLRHFSSRLLEPLRTERHFHEHDRSQRQPDLKEKFWDDVLGAGWPDTGGKRRGSCRGQRTRGHHINGLWNSLGKLDGVGGLAGPLKRLSSQGRRTLKPTTPNWSW